MLVTRKQRESGNQKAYHASPTVVRDCSRRIQNISGVAQGPAVRSVIRWVWFVATKGEARPHVRHETSRVHHAARRRGGGVAASGGRAAAGGGAGDRAAQRHRP